MNRRSAITIVAAALVLAVAVVIPVGSLMVRTGQPLKFDADSLDALASWSSYATAIGTLLLVVFAIVAGLEARHEFRLGHRPVVGISGARFTADGIDVRVENVGPGAMVNLNLRLWAGFAAPTVPEPPDLGELVERMLGEATTTEAMFASDLGALAPGGARPETLRYGPRAGSFDPAWAGGWGVIVWDAKATDIFGAEHPGSGYFLVEGEPAVDEST